MLCFSLLVLLIAQRCTSTLSTDRTSCRNDLDLMDEAIGEMKAIANNAYTRTLRATSANTQMSPADMRVTYFTFDAFFSIYPRGLNARVQSVLSMFRNVRKLARFNH
jgi:hypothetical protein